MILTGSEIEKCIQQGSIIITPFSADQVNPNSYNYRIGDNIKVFDSFDGKTCQFKLVKIPREGIILYPKQMYLGNTMEIIGSNIYAMSLIGRSSLGRLGLFLQLSANLGHTTACHQWTLEMYAVQPIKIYPRMIIGQVSFWTNEGDIHQYQGTYGKYNIPQESFINNNDTYRK